MVLMTKVLNIPYFTTHPFSRNIGSDIPKDVENRYKPRNQKFIPPS